MEKENHEVVDKFFESKFVNDEPASFMHQLIHGDSYEKSPTKMILTNSDKYFEGEFKINRT